MGNLTKRVLTAATLIPLVVAAVLQLDWPYIGVILAGVLLAGAWEWTTLAGWRDKPIARLLFLFSSAGWIGASALIPAAGVQLYLLAAVVWWAIAFAIVIAFQLDVWRPSKWSGPAWVVIGWLVVVPCWLSVVELHRAGEHGPGLVLIMLVIIWMADIGAYFAGRAFGKHKLASNVSPGKTWEGAVGGMVASVAAAVVYVQWIGVVEFTGFITLTAVVVVVSVLGDLTESLFKRVSGNKDSGSLLPGHGGVLDRIDSLTAAAPVFALGVALVEFQA